MAIHIHVAIMLVVGYDIFVMVHGWSLREKFRLCGWLLLAQIEFNG